MRYLHVLNAFLSASLQEEMAYRSNFVISLFNSLLGLISSTILYSLLLLFSSLAFWSNGFLVNWIFDGLFQLARHPMGFYPVWLRLILTWVLPIGMMTTMPVETLTGIGETTQLPLAGLLAVTSFVVASWLFQRGLRRYDSASS
ncbi:MAG: hypothetical protein GFH27_549289n124 [Chloroflexi bacterium AL-W]|nr:hypothetical protein [Chloroflexi bacterium AL-N1]NOK66856.1 hypothetical protein [Chloroflexi bacterium AL-N10]NOK74852.1 hypothetical protein [Chloroflexi bacterium AL-N5]NOK81459.1 hypothetical protein [Chloroflexi bacterium AL-W]NOK88928.1 hypothetical protein [Chloroflexi bacterium AL-N15]